MKRSIALWVVLRATALAQVGSLQGRVVDFQQAVIPRAAVELRIKGNSAPLQTTTTDDRGHFALAGIPSGTFELRISAPGFELHVQTVAVKAGDAVDLLSIPLAVGAVGGCGPGPLGPPTISLNPIHAGDTELYGTVTDMTGGFIARVRASLKPIEKKNRPATIVTGPEGSFYFSGIAPGTYELRATRKGYSDFVIDRLELKVGERTDIIEPLEILDCLEGFRCEPNRQVHTIVLCL